MRARIPARAGHTESVGVILYALVVEYAAIEALRERHPAWRLLRASNATLILAFLGEFFVEGNRGACPASEVAAALDDHLYALNTDIPADDGHEGFPKAA